MYGYIYRTIDLTNGKIYVGQKHSSRFLPNYLGSGSQIKEAVQLKGKSSFQVDLLEEVEDVNDMDDRERFWIDKLHSQDPEIGYNLMPGGAVERRLVGPLNPFYGKHHTEETRQRLSQLNSSRSRPHTEEEKVKISAALKGREVTWKDKLSQNAKVNPNYGMKGKHVSEEVKQKISKYHKARFEDPNAREHMSKLTQSAWDDPEYRRKHIEGMRGKKRKVTYKTCPICGNTISASNYKRHVAAMHIIDNK